MNLKVKHKNYFYYFHPVTLLFYYTLLIISLFKCQYDTVLIYTFISLSVCSIYLKGIKSYIKSSVYYIFIIILTGIFNVVFNHSGENVFLYVNDVPLTFDALFYGLYTGIFVCCLLLWFTTFNESMDNGKINYLLGTRLKSIGLIISMTFSFTDKFRHKTDIIRQTLYTQGMKSLNLKYGATVFSLLLTVMLEDSSVTADSMIARGYMSKRRKPYKKYPIFMMDIFLTVLSAAIFLLVFFFDGFIVLLILIPVLYNIYREAAFYTLEKHT